MYTGAEAPVVGAEAPTNIQVFLSKSGSPLACARAPYGGRWGRGDAHGTPLQFPPKFSPLMFFDFSDSGQSFQLFLRKMVRK